MPQYISEVRTGTDNTPADSFEDPPVVINPGMRDGNLTTTAYRITSNSSFNNIMLALFAQVDIIYLYTRTDLGAAVLPELTWTLFTNDILGTTWNVTTPSIIGVTYNSAEQRFEIDITETSMNYLKLVLDIPLTGPTIDFTEVMVFDIIQL